MTEQKDKKQTLGYFDVIGEVAVDSKAFSLGQAGKNNASWLQNIFNPRVDGVDGQSLYMRFSSGYDSVKGKTIYARSKSETNLEIPFGDRNNQNMISLVDDKSFIKVGIEKIVEKNAETGKEYKVWEFNKFLDSFDAIAFLNQMMPLASKNKVRLVGRIKNSVYNDEVQRNYELQTIYLLNGNEEEGKELAPKFSFTQNVLLTEGAVDQSKLESEGVATVNAKIYVKIKKEFKVLPLEFMMIAKDDSQKETFKKVIDRYFDIKGDTVRRINLDCRFESGYIASNIEESDLPDDAKELIEDGLYSKEEVMKMYANKDRVDRLVITRPLIRKIDNKPQVDFDDKEFELKDLEGKVVEIAKDEVIQNESEVDELLNELENL